MGTGLDRAGDGRGGAESNEIASSAYFKPPTCVAVRGLAAPLPLPQFPRQIQQPTQAPSLSLVPSRSVTSLPAHLHPPWVPPQSCPPRRLTGRAACPSPPLHSPMPLVPTLSTHHLVLSSPHNRGETVIVRAEDTTTTKLASQPGADVNPAMLGH